MENKEEKCHGCVYLKHVKAVIDELEQKGHISQPDIVRELILDSFYAGCCQIHKSEKDEEKD